MNGAYLKLSYNSPKIQTKMLIDNQFTLTYRSCFGGILRYLWTAWMEVARNYISEYVAGYGIWFLHVLTVCFWIMFIYAFVSLSTCIKAISRTIPRTDVMILFRGIDSLFALCNCSSHSRWMTLCWMSKRFLLEWGRYFEIDEKSFGDYSMALQFFVTKVQSTKNVFNHWTKIQLNLIQRYG